MPFRPSRNARLRATLITAAGACTFTPSQRARLEEAAEAVFHERRAPLEAAQLASLAEGASVLAVTPRSVPVLARDTINRLPPSLRGIAVFATGVDFVDLGALEQRGIALANLPDYSAISAPRLIAPPRTAKRLPNTAPGAAGLTLSMDIDIFTPVDGRNGTR